MITKSDELTCSENLIYTDSCNYRGGSHLAGKPGRQWQILRAYFLIFLVGYILFHRFIDKVVQAS